MFMAVFVLILILYDVFVDHLNLSVNKLRCLPVKYRQALCQVFICRRIFLVKALHGLIGGNKATVMRKQAALPPLGLWVWWDRLFES